MSQNTQFNDRSIRVELYVLGFMEPEERKAFEQELAQQPQLQKQVNNFQNQMLSLSDQLPVVPVPQPLSSQIERSLDNYQAQATPTRQKNTSHSVGGFWHNLNFWRGFALAGFITTILLGVQLMQTTPPTELETRYVAVLVTPQDKSPDWIIQTSQQREIELIPLGAVEIPKGKALQFWTKAEGWNKPVSLGLVKKGQPIKVSVDQLPPLEANQLFELTLENENGSPTGLPTGPIYSIGRGIVTL